MRQFSVLPLNRHTGNPLELRPDPHTGQYAPVIKQASFDKVKSVCFVYFCYIPLEMGSANDYNTFLLDINIPHVRGI